MKKIITLFVVALLFAATASAQGLKRVYDTTINPMTQIDEALAKANASDDKFVICQVGGNWCPWCLRFADFITKDAEIDDVIANNFIYIHVNYLRSDKSDKAKALMTRLNNPQRFGFPVFVVLDKNGNVMHTQDSSFLESGENYDKQKVLRFLNNWTPSAVLKND